MKGICLSDCYQSYKNCEYCRTKELILVPSLLRSLEELGDTFLITQITYASRKFAGQETAQALGLARGRSQHIKSGVLNIYI